MKLPSSVRVLAAIVATVAILLLGFLLLISTPPSISGPSLQPSEDTFKRSTDSSVRGESFDPANSPGASSAEGSTRAAVAAFLTITDSGGEPIVGARVTWTSLRKDLFEGYVSQDQLDWEAVEAASIHLASDESGRVDLPVSSPQQETRSVLWLTHPRFVATPILLAPKQAPPHTAAMQAARGIRVAVSRDGGQPAPGASVIQVWFAGPLDEGSHLLDAARVFRQVYETDAHGVANVAPLLGEQGLRAWEGAVVSERWFGTSPAEVKLHLGLTFEVSGWVEVPPAFDLGRVVVTTSVLTHGDHIDYDRRGVSETGSWGPATIPVLPDALVLVRASAPDLVMNEVQRTGPAPGELVFVTHHLQSGVPLEVRLLDFDDEPVVGSSAGTAWMQGGQWVNKWGDADSTGLITLGPVLPGQVYLEAFADGYASTRLGPFEYVEHPAEPIIMRLSRAGTLRGWVTCAGEPVENFRVGFLVDGGGSMKSEAFTDRSDGSFELTQAPAGDLSIFAFSDELTQGPIVEVRLDTSTGEATDVHLDLPAPLLGRGQVVEAQSNVPLSDARVAVMIVMYNRRYEARGGRLKVDAKGHFEAQRFNPGQNTIEVSAPGWASAVAYASPVEGVVDFGVIHLARRQPLVLRLHNMPQGEKCVARAMGTELLPEALFDASGVATFDDVSPGQYTIHITVGLERTIRRQVELSPEQDWIFELDAGSEPNLTVEVVPPPGEELPSGATLGVCYRNDTDEIVRSFVYLTDSGTAEIWRPEGREIVLQVGAERESCIMMRVVDAGDASTHIRLTLDTREARFRVLHDAEPLPQASVGLQTAGDGVRWYLAGTTDAAGEVTFQGLPPSGLLVTATHDIHGILPAVPVDLDEALGDGMELDLDVDSRLSVRLVDDGTPLPGLPITFSTHQIEQRIGARSSDADGVATLAPVAPGRYRALVRHPSVWPVDQTIEATSDHAGPASIDVRRRADLRITLNGPGRAGLRVQLESISNDGHPAAWLQAGQITSSPPGMLTDDEGVLAIRGLPHGEYRWSVETSTGDVPSGTVKLEHASIAELRIAVP